MHQFVTWESYGFHFSLLSLLHHGHTNDSEGSWLWSWACSPMTYLSFGQGWVNSSLKGSKKFSFDTFKGDYTVIMVRNFRMQAENSYSCKFHCSLYQLLLVPDLYYYCVWRGKNELVNKDLMYGTHPSGEYLADLRLSADGTVNVLTCYSHLQ